MKTTISITSSSISFIWKEKVAKDLENPVELVNDRKMFDGALCNARWSATLSFFCCWLFFIIIFLRNGIWINFIYLENWVRHESFLFFFLDLPILSAGIRNFFKTLTNTRWQYFKVVLHIWICAFQFTKFAFMAFLEWSLVEWKAVEISFLLLWSGKYGVWSWNNYRYFSLLCVYRSSYKCPKSHQCLAHLELEISSIICLRV